MKCKVLVMAVFIALAALGVGGCAGSSLSSLSARDSVTTAATNPRAGGPTSATTAAPTSTVPPIPAGTTGGLVILLQELVGATSRGAGLPQYDQYRFALFPSGRAFWGRGSPHARMQMRQADLTAGEVTLLRGWVHEAQLGALKKEYPPESDLISQILLLTVRDGDTRSEVKLWLSDHSSVSPSFPASLVQFLDRLSSFSATAETLFRPERIEIMVTEGVKRTEHGLPLPPELDPATMEAAWRNEERVVYVKHFSGSEAKRLEELIDAQPYYTGPTRSYQVSYRPLDVPQP